MKVLEISSLVIPEVKVVKFARFCDTRGYFTEPYRESQMAELPFWAKRTLVQVNESFSRKGVMRGLHFQWNPFMGKLVRTVHGHMIDIFADVRVGSPNFGQVACYDMPERKEGADYDEWIWVPEGFAHGNLFLEDTRICYVCSGEYAINSEAGISPLAEDLDWSLCDSKMKRIIDKAKPSLIITDKDRNGLSIKAWKDDTRSKEVSYKVVQKEVRRFYD